MADLAPVRYAVDGAPAPEQWSARSGHGFDATLSRLKEAIAAEELWLIAEIDPQMLLRRGGLAIAPTRQLLFFHPRFMGRVLAADARAIVEAPLKIVVLADADGAVVLCGPDAAARFGSFSELRDLGEELAAIVARIVGTVAV